MSKNPLRVPLIALLFAMSLPIKATEPHYPTIATLNQVDHCQALPSIRVSSAHHKQGNWQQHTQHKVLLKADAIGATHIVIDSIESIGAFNGIINANAYRCKG